MEDEKRRAAHLHSTLALTAQGVPLGVLDANCQAPPTRGADDQRTSANIPIEQKKTNDRIQGLRQCEQAAARMPQTRLVSVMAREADFFELFDEQRQRNKVDLLVRAKHDRCIDDPSRAEQRTLFERLPRPPQG